MDFVHFKRYHNSKLTARLHEEMAGFRRNWLASDDHNLVLHLEPYRETNYMICHGQVKP